MVTVSPPPQPAFPHLPALQAYGGTTSSVVSASTNVAVAGASMNARQAPSHANSAIHVSTAAPASIFSNRSVGIRSDHPTGTQDARSGLFTCRTSAITSPNATMFE